MEKYAKKYNGCNAIRVVSVEYLRSQGINSICHLCGKPISKGFYVNGNRYLENKNIFENSLHNIFLLFHHKCKKKWLRDQRDVKHD